MTKLCIIFLFPFILTSCKKKLEHTKPIEESITESVYASGVIKSKNQYKVFSTVNGLISEVLVTEGDTVKAGDIIIKLKNTSAQLNTENAKITADYNAVNANLEKLNELQININLAKAKMDEDASLQRRQQNLWNENIGSKNELELRKLAYENSFAAYEAAKLRYIQLQKQAQFQDKQSKKNVEISSTLKNDYSIKSNADGKVYSILMKRGEMVNTLNPVAIIGDTKEFEIELQVDEYDIGKIKLKQKVVVSMDSYKGKVFEAMVTKINPIMNERTKSFTIYADFVTQANTLFANLTCEANIVVAIKEKAMTIPRNYLMEGDSVLLIKNEKRKVIVGLKDFKKVEIISGINSNEDVYKPEL